MTIWTSTVDSPVGPLRLFASLSGVRALLWRNSDVRQVKSEADPIVDNSHPTLAQLAKQLDEYFQGSRLDFDLPLDPIGTDFQMQAWQALSQIPFGETRSYGEQARSIRRPKAVRAIGSANGRNPISIVVPCHRVIGSDGSLIGFGGGLDVKRWLLAHEARVLEGST